MRTLSCINYESLEQEWNNKAKDNSELTEEDAQRYLNERTDAMLVLCDNYGYDGILIDYTGLSMVGMQEDVLQQYKARQQNFFSRVLDWRIKHEGVSKCTPSVFYAQSPDFHKLGLCYYLKILYL
ncbi:hypothetical protein F3D66_05755 [Bacteroides ovatus]|uniref:Uncharacterized protein n=1 Tax=Bacteroides ovatus TaxID=28116 RepID=A0A6L3G6E5_BACOV|nr:hypothetical protein F3D66_05755 [Bacteroides ovatus]